MPVPAYLSVLFVTLAVLLGVLFLAGLFAACNRLGFSVAKKIGLVLGGIAVLSGWLGLLDFLTVRGFFADFQSLPPRIGLALLPPVLAIIVLGFSRVGRAFLLAIPETWLIEFQAFRILMEIILWRLFAEGIIPRQMTFEGRNFDVFVGLTAPLIAYLCFRKRVLSPRWAVAWNVLGLLILANIVVIANLSTPSPYRVFHNEPANTVIGHWPFIWLPGFVVPAAVAGHVWSLRQLVLKKRGSGPLEC